MSFHAGPESTATSLAEQILQLIYGDDLKGCAVRLDDIAAIIARGLEHQTKSTKELLELYEKVVEAVHLLSSAPDSSKIGDVQTLQALLSERLDAIHAVTTRTIETTSRLNEQRNPRD